MEHYIDKSALIAEIEKRKKEAESNCGGYKSCDDDIEYVRKDVFIKKAAAYLNEKFYFNNLHYAVENNTFNCMEEMFEDFEKYMEE